MPSQPQSLGGQSLDGSLFVPIGGKMFLIKTIFGKERIIYFHE